MKELKITPPEGYEIDKNKSTFEHIVFKKKTKEWVDLGLPSGTLWAKDNEEGYYTYYEAVEIFQDSLPTIIDFAELVHYCEWTWDKKRKGMVVTGQNENSIFFPAVGYRFNDSGALHDVGSYGYYCSASPPSNSYHAYYLNFFSGNVSPANNLNRSDGYSVRCIKK